MEVLRCVKDSFCVIGKEGSTRDGEGFVQRLWAQANGHYSEVAGLAKTGDNGHPAGFWGAMSDLARTNGPWEDGFTKGLYLAGVEVSAGAVPPEGWVKWTIPAYEYLIVKVEPGVPELFSAMIAYIKENGFQLAGAAHDFICPQENGQPYLYFPIRKI